MHRQALCLALVTCYTKERIHLAVNGRYDKAKMEDK
jgi:hypothetical protein